MGERAVVVGSGPNGLAAAVELARAGMPVTVYECADTPGGGLRSAELTLPGFVHDVCAAFFPVAVGAPFFRTLMDEGAGPEWVEAPAVYAHPLDDGTAAVAYTDVGRTADGLGADAKSYKDLFGPFVRDWDRLARDILYPPHFPVHPVLLARFGLRALTPAGSLARTKFNTRKARALFAGLAAHSFLPLEETGAAAVGMVLGITAHAVGWPMAKGGAGKVTEALVAYIRKRGGEVVTGRRINSLDELERYKVRMLDLTPKEFLRIAGDRLRGFYRMMLSNYRYGPAVFKIDWALSGPIPWKSPECGLAGTVHVGGALDEVAESEMAAARGRHAERPFVLVGQQSLFDGSRAPAGKQTGWAYCHVPNGSNVDMTERIEKQVERFAPGFRDLILARHTMNAAQYEAYNPNFAGGDITGGAQSISQLLARPVPGRNPYRTGVPGVYLCSSSTPPGSGIHGMCGYHAARAALRDVMGIAA